MEARRDDEAAISHSNELSAPFCLCWAVGTVGKHQPTIESFSLITIASDAVMKPIHHRMPVILTTTQYSEWLDTSLLETEQLGILFRPFPPEEMEAFPVSVMVNKRRHDQPECMIPIQ
ncbi:MAG: hypothetical protein E4H32_02590 [Nitrospirales bacterium]|nr:MAG: hypothetical protein E4H32_02590 [Nitrospirales bacterium]